MEGIENKVYVIKGKKGPYHYKNGYSINFWVSDGKHHNIELIYWGPADREKVAEIYERAEVDGGIRVIKGFPKKYKGILSISANEIEIIPKDKVSVVRRENRDIEEMKGEMRKYINSISDDRIREIVEEVFNPEFMEKFSVHPGAVEIHHARRGGLIEHTLEVVRIVELLCEMYPKINRDLAIAGAILHDIGKIDEITVTSRIKSEFNNQLVGHIVYGVRRLTKVLDKLKVEEELSDRLIHIMISHHGQLEYGSPKEPMTLEAFAVSAADNTSATMSQVIDFIEISKENTEDNNMYNRRLGRNIYLEN